MHINIATDTIEVLRPVDPQTANLHNTLPNPPLEESVQIPPDDIASTPGPIAVVSSVNRTRKPDRRRGRGRGSRSAGGEANSTGQYLKEIGEAPLLSREDEIDLAKRIEKGNIARADVDRSIEKKVTQEQARAIKDGDAAKDKFIRSNLRLVVLIAKRYPLSPGIELLDLIQEGNLGLEHAVDKFDYRKGFKFSTYAAHWIRQNIRRGLNQKKSLVRAPNDRVEQLKNALKEVDGNSELLTGEEYRLYILSNPLSLNFKVGDKPSDKELGELIPDSRQTPEDIVIGKAEEIQVTSLLDTLDEQSKNAVKMRFGLEDDKERTYIDIGEALGVSSEKARRICKKAIETIRERAVRDSERFETEQM